MSMSILGKKNASNASETARCKAVLLVVLVCTSKNILGLCHDLHVTVRHPQLPCWLMFPVFSWQHCQVIKTYLGQLPIDRIWPHLSSISWRLHALQHGLTKKGCQLPSHGKIRQIFNGGASLLRLSQLGSFLSESTCSLHATQKRTRVHILKLKTWNLNEGSKIQSTKILK